LALWHSSGLEEIRVGVMTRTAPPLPSQVSQSDHLPSYRNASSAGLLRSTVVTRFAATMSPSDFPPARLPVMSSRKPLTPLPSRVPRASAGRITPPTACFANWRTSNSSMTSFQIIRSAKLPGAPDERRYFLKSEICNLSFSATR
jgi:hypothetical protein